MRGRLGDKVRFKNDLPDLKEKITEILNSME
jgi:hypothetical protein